MSLHGLLENAHLDALGLLDERELAEFNAAFAAAPPQVQAHIRSEQARWANLDFLLPRVEAPESLRARVLAAVGEAMIASEVRGENDTMTLRPSKRVSRLWRTGAVGMLAVCVVLGAAFLNVYEQNQVMSGTMSNADLQKSVLVAVGGTEMNDTLFSESTRRIHFKAVDETFTGQVSVLFHPGWDFGHLACQRLPERAGETYQIAVLSGDGKVTSTVGTLDAGKDLKVMELPRSVLATGTRLAIVSVAKGSNITTILMTARV